MTYLENIKNLIENDIVFQRKTRLHEENHKVNTYLEIGKLIVEAQGGGNHAKYGNNLIFEKCGAVPHKLAWTNISIILPIKNINKRNYYINLCVIQNLSSRQLKSKLKNKEGMK